LKSSSKSFVIIAGTRPEVIKLAPVYRAFMEKKQNVQFWMTGQHQSLAMEPALFFELPISKQWSALRSGQSSNELLAKLVLQLDAEFEQQKPDVVIVQGDTTTALAGALSAFHRGIQVAHVEAGLRSGDLKAPFPEEMNRRVIDSFADWRFPPTQLSYDELKKEGHPRVSRPTGNTGIDALYWARDKVRASGYWPEGVPKIPAGMRLVLSTGHRRESLGEPLVRILRALGEEVQKRPDLMLLHVGHPNPVAAENAHSALAGFERVNILSALNYPGFVTLLDRAAVVVSDSGGVQEEAPSFGVPVLITRDVTERPEVLQCGGVLVGTDPRKLKAAFIHAIEQPKWEGDVKQTPFGDGRASVRICDEILEALSKAKVSVTLPSVGKNGLPRPRDLESPREV
jgi:UDP-N-acetylglucosamine 2-epimerase